MLQFLIPRLAFFIWSAAILVTTYGTIVALVHLQKRNTGDLNDDEILALEEKDYELEPVSILKPLKGIDAGIEHNLETFMQLDYPKYEVLFSVTDAMDPVVPLVRKLIAKYPKVNASLTVCDENNGPNPKINNLLTTYTDALYDWILISDSNTRMSPLHLRSLGQQFKNRVAMQTSIVAGVDAQGIGGHLESAFLNTFYARSVLTLKTLGHPCVIGKCMMFRKSVLERTGGLLSLEEHIAEDYAAGRKLHQLGFRVQVSNNPIRQYIGPYAFKTFWSRHIRWGRLRKLQTPFGFVAEPFFNSILSGLIGAFAFSHVFGISAPLFFLGHLTGWFLCDWILYSRVSDPPGFSFIGVWILREVLHFPLWLHIAAGNSIVWRGKVIHLKRPVFQIEKYTLHGLQDFLRKPHQHAIDMIGSAEDAITNACALFDAETDEEFYFKPEAVRLVGVKDVPPNPGKERGCEPRPPENSA
jgi:ceramide glucosyltransferase